jgi:hypothetical protein
MSGAQARKKHLEHMSGAQIGNILQPSNGIRDDLIRIGLKPKNHILANKRHIKQIQKENKEIQKVLFIK